MIIDSFDNKSKPFLRAEDLYETVPANDIVTIVTFKKNVIDLVVKEFQGKLEIKYPTTNDTQDIYSFFYNDRKYFIYMTPIGSTMAATIMKEVSVVTGSRKFIFFGSCGVLNEEVCRGKIIIPTEAYRDEGMSYHYAPPSDYIKIRNSIRLQDIVGSLNVPFVAGKVWTTDAIYMETVNKVKKHKSEGCIAVEMEVAGIEAAANFYGLENYNILFSADSLDKEEEWYREDFGGNKELELQLKVFRVALNVATKL